MKLFANFIWLLLTIENIVCFQVWNKGSSVQTPFSAYTFQYWTSKALAERNLSVLATNSSIMETIKCNQPSTVDTDSTNAQVMSHIHTNTKCQCSNETKEAEKELSVLTKIKLYIKKKKLDLNRTFKKNAPIAKRKPTLMSYNSIQSNYTSNEKYNRSFNVRDIASNTEINRNPFSLDIFRSSPSHKNNYLGGIHAPVIIHYKAVNSSAEGHNILVTTEINYISNNVINQSMQTIKYGIGDTSNLLNAHVGILLEENGKFNQQTNASNALKSIFILKEAKHGLESELLQRNPKLDYLLVRIHRSNQNFSKAVLEQSRKTKYINTNRTDRASQNHKNKFLSIKESMELDNIKLPKNQTDKTESPKHLVRRFTNNCKQKRTKISNRDVHKTIKAINHKGVQRQYVELKILAPISEPFPNLFNETPGNLFKSNFMRNVCKSVKNTKDKNIEIEFT